MRKPTSLAATPFKSTRELGYHGERLVTSLLPGAVHINESYEQHLPFDVIWNDVYIDVKTSANEFLNGKFMFTPSAAIVHRGYIIVHVALAGENTYFWVERYRANCRNSFHTNSAIMGDRLAERITEVKLLPEPEITDERIMRADISINNDRYLELIRVSSTLTSRYGVKVSVLDVVNQAIDEYINSSKTK